MNFLLLLNLVAVVATFWKVSCRMPPLLDTFNVLNTHVGQLLDIVATQGKTITDQTAQLQAQTAQIGELQAQVAGSADVPAVQQGMADLDARVVAVVAPPQ